MGRRALRKIDPALDLSPFLYELEDLPEPSDVSELFDRPAPLEIEVGSGKGLFLATAAAGNPDHNFLGVEVARKYAKFSAARLAQRQQENAKMISGDAMRIFRDFLANDSLAAVHVYFPDPWWKKRHRKRRIMQADFLKHVQRTLRPGGILHFWTDVEEYFDESIELIREATSFEGPSAVPESGAEHDLDYRTHFERRMRLSGEPVFRANFTKPS